MERFARSLLLACTVMVCLRMPASALTYQDDLSDLSQNSIKSYSNLSPFAMDGSYWSSLPDRSAFSFASTSNPMGSATYRVSNAEQVAVGLYTLAGSFVCRSSDGGWALGVTQEDTGALAGQALPQASYSPSARAVYSQIGGVLYKAYAGDGGTVLQPTAESPGDLVGYGVNVYASKNGQGWSRLPLTRLSWQYRARAPFVYEEYTAPVPAGTTHVRVELNDVNGMEAWSQPGQTVQKVSNTYNCLASVTILGTNLQLGEAEPLREETVPSEADSRSAQSALSSHAPGGGAGGASSAASGSQTTSSGESARYSAPKFEGVIRSSAAGGRSGGESGAARTQRDSALSVDTAPEESLPAWDSPVQYVPTKNDDDKHFTAGVTMYIIGVSIALCFVVLASAGKKK